eukprot:6207424-Pleurochrysis_carterae.AAC.4
MYCGSSEMYIKGDLYSYPCHVVNAHLKFRCKSGTEPVSDALHCYLSIWRRGQLTCQCFMNHALGLAAAFHVMDG